MPAEGRLLTIHCSGPEPITPTVGDDRGFGYEGIRLYFAALEPQRERIPAYRELLDEQEKERAARFRFEADRERFIIAHGLLRKLLGEHLGARPEELHIARGPYGKPYIEGSDLRFNLSDTKDALLIAFTHRQEIGADIETMARTVDHIAVGEHYFTPEEMLSVRAATLGPAPTSGTIDPLGRPLGTTDDIASKRRFLEFWTRKEAVLKASGVGIMDDLRNLRVDGERNTMVIAHEAFISMAAEEYHVHTWHVGQDHLISLASPVKVKDVKVWGVEEM